MVTELKKQIKEQIEELGIKDLGLLKNWITARINYIEAVEEYEISSRLKKNRNNRRLVQQALEISELTDHKTIDLKDVLEAAYGLSEEEVIHHLDYFKKEGIIFEPKKDVYKFLR